MKHQCSNKEKAVHEGLDLVQDPELNMSIVDLGLVYDVKINEENDVVITMTLTSLGCPLFNVIESDIKDQMNKLGYPNEKIKIELTFDPPWTMEKMSDRAKAILGI
ncbi:MAG: metal-sulfur cluster assembly factor [Candidatus Roizmanbacteria bacterium]